MSESEDHVRTLAGAGDAGRAGSESAGRAGSESAGPGGGQRAGVMGAVGRGCYRHRVLTVLGWVVGVACLVVLWVQFGAAADDNFTGNDPGQAILDQHFAQESGDALTLAIRSGARIDSAGVRERVGQALVPFARAAHVSSVTDPYTTPGHVSADGHIAYATVQFSLPSASIPGREVSTLMNDATAASGHGVTFSLGGDLVDQAETAYGGPTEGIGVGAAAVVLLIAFGSLLAMGLPVATAVLGIGAGLSLIALVGHVFPAPSFAPIVASLIGLGVGVDYALFIVTRFREGLRGDAGGRPPARQQSEGLKAGLGAEDALVASMRTAGKSVLVAGTTVVIGLLGLLVLRQSLMTGVAVAAALAVAMTVLASLTLLPALIGFTGTRLGSATWLSRRRRGSALHRTGKAAAAKAGVRQPVTERWAGVVQRHPVITAVVATAVILVLAAPALGMKLNMPDESTQQRGTMGYASYAAMAQGFGPGFDAPLIVAATLPSRDAALPSRGVAGLASAVRGTPGVARVTPAVVSRDGRAAMLIAYPTTQEQDPATNTLVNRLSGTVLPRATAGTGIRAYVTGPNAGNVAFANEIGQRLPWLIAIVVALAMVLLVVVFRSVVVAVKAALMNLLSISAAYGVLVMVAQHGWLRGVFGFPERMPVTTWVPMFLFVILFGLSMDYEVFLLSRIREHWLATRDNAASVARGLASTARVISAAAAIMVVVFLSNVLGADVSVKQIGLGLAVAVFIDATVVRLALVPAVMELLGAANWWLPGWLDRVLPRGAEAGSQADAGYSGVPESVGAAE